VTEALALASALLIGGSDFLGGVLARRTSPVRVAALGQLVSFALAIPAALAVGATRVTGVDAGWSVLSGVTVAAGLALFYSGMRHGLISIVAPTAAVTSVTVPVVYALVRGERPGAAALAGFVLALVAVTIVSMAPGDVRAPRRESVTGVVGLSIAAGVLFGVFFISFSRTSDDAGLWPVAISRGTSAGICLLLLLVTLRELGAGPVVRFVLPIGALETAAAVLLLLALQRGPVAIASVLASLYPVTTVLLAAGLLQERLARLQYAGVLLALVSAVLVSTG
jgi:drug/metabolite transporter (DMT)-like permease